jgi:hypothetical protein
MLIVISGNGAGGRWQTELNKNGGHRMPALAASKK